MHRIVVALLVAGALAPNAVAEEVALEDAMREDVVLRALVDENQRSIEKLRLEGLAEPYFIEYGLVDGHGVWISADLGAVTGRNEYRQRSLRTDVRVGSYELDNTNFGGGGYSYWGGGSGATMPIEDDYNAIRQAIWWMTDRDYKQVAEMFEEKQAFMKSRMIEDKPDDMSREEPSVYCEPRCAVEIDPAALEQIAVGLSTIFREYPDIQDSGVNVSGSAGNQYVVNTEGTRIRTASTGYSVAVSATVQADDGMELSDQLSVDVNRWEDLPSMDELTERCREMITRLVDVRNAPRFEETYTGPVLFEAPAAAALFEQIYVHNFNGGQRPVGSRTSADDFVNKLNRRVLPRYMSVVDDPTLTEFDGKRLLGHYRYDGQGVAAQRVVLVEEGRLKNLLMSRNPSKEFSNSNGHGRNLMYPRPAIGNLVVSTDSGLSDEELREELLEACEDEGLEYGLRIESLGGSASNPLVIYKVFTDDREELVRGAEVADFDLKSFKRMLAAGAESHVANSSGRTMGHTVIAPAFLFEELDLAKIDRDFEKPPILPTPLARD